MRQLFCNLAAAKQMRCLFLLSGLQMQKLFSLLTVIRKHMWPWSPRIMLLIPKVSCLPTETPKKVQTRKIKITSCTQASLSSSSLTWIIASFLCANNTNYCPTPPEFYLDLIFCKCSLQHHSFSYRYVFLLQCK